MDFRKFYSILSEKKDHLINRLEGLTDEQKKEIIDFFNRKPNLEGKIDWNNKNLTYADFEPIIKERSKTEVKKAVSKSGIAGLIEGKDFIELPLNSDEVHAYMPMNYEASRLIASDKIGGCEGKWCTAYQKTDYYWNNYTGRRIIFIYFIIEKNNKKYAMALYPKEKFENQDTSGFIEVFNDADSSIDPDDFFNMMKDMYKISKGQIMDHIDIFKMVRNYIKTHRPLVKLTEEELEDEAKGCISKILGWKKQKNEKILAIAKDKINKYYNTLTDWIKDQKPDKAGIKQNIRVTVDEWKILYGVILKYMSSQMELLENNLVNKINAFTYCDYPAYFIYKGSFTSQQIVEKSGLATILKGLKWSIKRPQSYGKFKDSYETLMKSWFNDMEIHSFDQIPLEWFKKWLTYNYKNNIDQFQICKENFVDDFSTAKYHLTAQSATTYGAKKIRPYQSILSDKEKEYLNNLINTIERSEYSKNRQQTTLKL
jgi:hypothetical protein